MACAESAVIMKTKTLKSKIIACLCFFSTSAWAMPAAAELQVSFQYMLSDFSGTIRSQWAQLGFDQKNKEVYTFNQGGNEVRIFNEQGMEIFTFGEESEMISATDIAIGENGDIYLLPRLNSALSIEILDYRGEHAGTLAIQNIPAQLQGFSADRLEFRDGIFYLVNSRSSKIITANREGEFLQLHDVGSRLLEIAEEQDPERKRNLELELSSFCVGGQGEMYFTVPVLFAAFKLDRDGELESFGRAGSGPGKFGVVAGIACDGNGNIYVADRLRSVVMVFDRNFQFQGEFGYRGGQDDNLVVPNELAVDETAGRVFVAQGANRGVSVYKINFEQTP